MDKIEIFCDASIKQFECGTIGCAGAIALLNRQLTDYKSLQFVQGTNNLSEITAIYLAVQLAYKVITNLNLSNYVVYIYSDSKISVFGLKHWIDAWSKQTYDGVMFNSQGQRVANQDMFVNVFVYLKNKKIQTYLLHCKGHIDVNKPIDIEKAKKVFLESNGYEISDDEVKFISTYNNMVDNLTRDQLNKIDLNNITPNNDKEMMCHYLLPIDYKQFIK